MIPPVQVVDDERQKKNPLRLAPKGGEDQVYSLPLRRAYQMTDHDHHAGEKQRVQERNGGKAGLGVHKWSRLSNDSC